MEQAGDIYENIKLEEAAIDGRYTERKPIKNWEEFKEFTGNMKFKITQEVQEVEKRGAEDVRAFSDSLGVSSQKFEEIKLKREPEILKIKTEGVELGNKAQKFVDEFSDEIKEKMDGGELMQKIARQKEDIQAEINEKIKKLQEMYEEFAAKIEKIKQKLNEILSAMEAELRESKIKEVREDINKI
jgi:predicted  nucleic acid-binding Zn-ribbon protein